jgi:hypothetical protein
MSDDQGNRVDRPRQRAVQSRQEQGRADAGRAVRQQIFSPVPTCEAPGGCTNPGGAFTTERGGRIYQFCSEACRANFESIPQT